MVRHLRAASILALTGFIFTSKPWLQWLNTLSPETGLLVKNVVILLILIILHSTDSIVGSPHIQALGVLLVYTAFTIIFDYQSGWIDDVGAQNIEHQTPDGAIYERTRTMLRLAPDSARIVTFVVVPFVLFLVGSNLIRHQKVSIV